MNILPKGRTTNITEQELNGELLVYDLINNKALSLNETSKRVFQSCDGQTSFEELKDKYQFTDDLIFLTLEKLHGENLLESEVKTPFAGLSRREVIKRVGLGTMVALPVISGLIAPTAASAASPGAGQPVNSIVGDVRVRTAQAPYPVCPSQTDRNTECDQQFGNLCASTNAGNTDGCTPITAGALQGYEFNCYCV